MSFRRSFVIAFSIAAGFVFLTKVLGGLLLCLGIVFVMMGFPAIGNFFCHDILQLNQQVLFRLCAGLIEFSFYLSLLVICAMPYWLEIIFHRPRQS